MDSNSFSSSFRFCFKSVNRLALIGEPTCTNRLSDSSKSLKAFFPKLLLIQAMKFSASERVSSLPTSMRWRSGCRYP